MHFPGSAKKLLSWYSHAAIKSQHNPQDPWFYRININHTSDSSSGMILLLQPVFPVVIREALSIVFVSINSFIKAWGTFSGWKTRHKHLPFTCVWDYCIYLLSAMCYYTACMVCNLPFCAQSYTNLLMYNVMWIPSIKTKITQKASHGERKWWSRKAFSLQSWMRKESVSD